MTAFPLIQAQAALSCFSPQLVSGKIAQLRLRGYEFWDDSPDDSPVEEYLSANSDLIDPLLAIYPIIAGYQSVEAVGLEFVSYPEESCEYLSIRVGIRAKDVEERLDLERRIFRKAVIPLAENVEERLSLRSYHIQ